MMSHPLLGPNMCLALFGLDQALTREGRGRGFMPSLYRTQLDDGMPLSTSGAVPIHILEDPHTFFLYH